MSTPTEDRPSIVAAIIVESGKVLLVRRRVREGTLSWQFPAGQSERGGGSNIPLYAGIAGTMAVLAAIGWLVTSILHNMRC